MKKHILTILTIITILLSSLPVVAEQDPNFNKEGYPIVNETVTLTALVGTGPDSPSDLNTITIIKEAEEETNVHIDWIGVSAGTALNERKSLMLATDDLPDIFYSRVTDTELAKYGAEGSFIPMEDLIAQYAPNLSAILEARPDLRAYATAPDGHIYGVPKVSEGPWSAVNRIYGINTKWLNDLNLEMPTNLAEFEAVLIAFRDKDPNGNGIADEVPLSFSAGDNFSIAVFEYVFSALGLPINSSLFDIKDEKVYCVATDPAFRQGVEILAKWYAEGLIDPESFIMNHGQWTAKLNLEPSIMGVAPCWDIADYIATPELLADYDYMPALKNNDGSDPIMVCPPTYGYFRGSGVITKACEHPEVAMRYIDYWFTPLNSYQSMEGKIGERLFRQEDGSLQLSSGDTTQVGAMEWARQASCLAFDGIWYVDAQQYATELRLPSTDKKVAHITANILPYADPDPWIAPFYTPEESEAIAIKLTDIRNLINREAGNWIINGVDDAKWDSLQSELAKIGLDDVLSIVQVAYDRTVN
jgi:putative aldouronate transport system substrate-binding protein